jgi:hypothetical protein
MIDILHITAVKYDIQTKNYFDLQIKGPLFLINFNAACGVCCAWDVSARFDASVHHCSGRRDAEEKLLLSSKMPFCID